MRFAQIARGALCDRPCRDVVGWLVTSELFGSPCMLY